jgi:hypothetical protein
MLVGEGESLRGPKSADMLTSAFVESTRAPRAAAAAYPGQDDGRLLAVAGERPAHAPGIFKAIVRFGRRRRSHLWQSASPAPPRATISEC